MDICINAMLGWMDKLISLRAERQRREARHEKFTHENCTLSTIHLSPAGLGLVMMKMNGNNNYQGTIGEGKGGESSGTGDIPSDPRLTLTVMVIFHICIFMKIIT